jgi:restriction system protein
LTQRGVRRRYEARLADYEMDEKRRSDAVEAIRAKHEEEGRALLSEVEKRRELLRDFERSYLEGNATALLFYTEIVLQVSSYPGVALNIFSADYASGSKELTVNYELPAIEIVPGVVEYKYVRTRDAAKSQHNNQGVRSYK